MAIHISRTAVIVARSFALVGAIGGTFAQSPPGLAQAPYTYTVIAPLGTAGTYAPSINNAGQVAFITFNGTVYRGDGTDLISLYEANAEQGAPNGYVSINASGTVAFGSGSVFTSAILVADGIGPAAPLAEDNSTWEGVFQPSINDAGQVVFAARLHATARTFIVTGSAFTPVASPGDPVPGGSLVEAFGPKINNSGDVGFTATVSSGATDIFRSTNTVVTRMATASASGELTFGMNDAGVVAFWSQQSTENGAEQRILTSDGVTEKEIAKSSPGFVPQPHRAPVNDAGVVVFLVSDGLGGPNAVFAGDGNSVPWPVLQPGDRIDGLGVVRDTSISNDALNDHGQVAIVVTYDDGTGSSKAAIVRADPVNFAPVADDAAVSTNEDQALNGTLPASDANGDPLTFSLVTNGVLGSAVITDGATGSYTYTPNADANGTDTLTFVASDGAVNSNVGTITVSIVPVNDAPVAQNGAASTFVSTPVTGTLVASDIDTSSLIFAVESNGAKGTAVVTNPTTGAYTYTPAAGQTGVDTFTFRASDGSLNSNTATVTVSIAANRPPTATNGSLSTREDRAASGRLAATDADGNTLTFAIVSNGSLGAATITNLARGGYSYVPRPNAHGTDTFTFRASDGVALSNVATVTVTITPVNDPPVAVNGAVATTAGIPVSGTLVASDVDGDALAFVLSRSPRRGTVAVAANGTFTYTPRAGFIGTDSFGFRASDGLATSAQAIVTVTVQ